MDLFVFTSDLIKMVIALFIVVDPLGNVPIFMSLTENMDRSQRRRTFRLATLTGLILLAFFSVVGQNILILFGISLDSFMIAGGILLLIVAIRLLIVGGWGEIKTAKGKADAPKLTITQAIEDWREINAGRLNPQMAFMSGKIKISGDMSLAMKLGSIMGG